MRAWILPAIVCFAFSNPVLAGEPSGILLDVPFIAQEKNGCGAAAAAMVMQYWNRELGRAASVDAKAMHRQLYSSPARGVYASDLQRFLRSHGYRTYAFRGEVQDLKHHLEKGRPLIVALKGGGDALHYVVATGFDFEENLVLKHDPAGRKLMKQRRTEFEAEWRGADNWTLLALPDDQAAAR